MVAAAPLPTTKDSLLACQIVNQLAETNRASLRQLSVAVKDGAVTLRGRVASFHERQIAIQTCRVMTGIERLIDAVEVAAAY